MRRSTSAILGLLLIGAAASPAGATPLGASGGATFGTAATPIAMCGYSCRSGGRYIPGPPSVCYAEGLNYCGSSRDRGPPVYYERRRRDFYDDEPPQRRRRPGEPSFYFGR